MKKRKHHYVWKHYLKSWTQDEKIFCLRQGKILHTDLNNVANERDFYKLRILSKEDLYWINKLVIENSPKFLQSLHKQFVTTYNFPFIIREMLQQRNDDSSELFHTVDELIHNFEENAHCIIEESGLPFIEELLNKNLGFFDHEERMMEFIHFLSAQYFRTKKIKQDVIRNLTTGSKVLQNIHQIWNVISHLFSTNFSYHLFARRNEYSLIFLENHTINPFLTSDQPAINTFAVNYKGTEPVKELELYYPVSPEFAILFTTKKKIYPSRIHNTTENEVSSFNSMIFDSFHEQVFALNQNQLNIFNKKKEGL